MGKGLARSSMSH